MKNNYKVACIIIAILCQIQVLKAQDFSVIPSTFKGGSTGSSTNDSRTLEYANNEASLSQYGGFLDVKLPATGHFRTEIYNDKWYMVDPEGYLYFGIGINSVNAESGYTNVNLPNDLKDAGFNHLANWSDFESINSGSEKIPYVFRELFIVGYKNESQANKDLYGDGIIPVFDTEFLSFADNLAKTVALKKDDPYCIGVFSDNEMPIYSNSTYGELLDRYLDITNKTNSNYLGAHDWMIARKGTNYTIDNDDRNDFHGYLMSTYYRIVHTAIKKYAPNMLYLGSRLHGAAKNYESIYKDSAPFIDVFSVNYYGPFEPDTTLLEMWTEQSGKPFMISEFYAKGFDVDLDNSGGAGYHVPTQVDRAAYFENFAINLLESKGCLSYQWFRFQDDASNKGVINANGEWYSELKTSLIKISKDIYNFREFLALEDASNTGADGDKLYAIEDSFTRGGSNANKNYDGELLIVKESPTNADFSRRTWLKFDVSEYVAIESATLHLTGNQSSGNAFDMTLLGVEDDSWSEESITWNNAPEASTVIAGVFSSNGNVGSRYDSYQIDITDYVRAEIAGNKIVSLNLVDAASSNEQFRIREKEDAANNSPAYITILTTELSTEAPIKSNFKMYPNPVNDRLEIDSKTIIQIIEFYNINGAVILTKNSFNSKNAVVDVSTLYPGVYLVKITNINGEVEVLRLLKDAY
ncbi:DNRLRE domain-containing protein [Mariniflexile sp. AS56]|uniref:T9SS type A sorting domain-containing protein n=1 Tax=Mariniflexile sp. AS56 TaxID=3063957 RepID=UPI0026ECAC0A|nr:DNRLRE domain-containing protein [Mariniflexile sp. AS56]MDO7174022.1 DNRLRE domain-containing protein [Mariniflexile sp. AS56]